MTHEILDDQYQESPSLEYVTLNDVQRIGNSKPLKFLIDFSSRDLKVKFSEYF